ncbi:MAG: hypothetical protein A2085_06010 [Gemmatimonadetes bacterium GWC2_71_10]|nr:MAG: hypothetical protein A2085_06010 [Gemmatimonadetes bacterium GWC2_71_10]
MRSSAALDASTSPSLRRTGAAAAMGGALPSTPMRTSIGMEMAAEERRGRAAEMLTCTSSPMCRISTSTRLPSTA